jgi:hypothetical protein
MATFTTGDSAPPLTGVCQSGTTPANLTGATVVLHIRWSDGTVITKTATVTDAPNGAWSYTWGASDITLTGPALVEAQVTYSGGAVQTFGPTSFAVQPQIA